MKPKPPLIVVAGTNASGKSGLGVALAQKYNGEVISADSRQVFRGLDLGSGKLTKEEMQGVPHHLIDVCDAGDFFSMADFQKLAIEAIDDILSRGKQPFLVGGTGLYVDCVAQGYVFSHKMPDLAYRNELEKLTTDELYEKLIALVPTVDVEKRNRNRVMRLLEKIHDGDDVVPTKNPQYEVLTLGVTWERSLLNQRIDERLEQRLKDGMLAEVQTLLDAGVSREFLYKLGLEYRFITQYLLGEIPDLDQMNLLLSTAIKQFGKRQMTWFRRDQTIEWLDMHQNPMDQACVLVDAFLGRCPKPCQRE